MIAAPLVPGVPFVPRLNPSMDVAGRSLAMYLARQLTSISTATKAVWTGLDTMRSNILTRVIEAEGELRTQAG